MTAPPSDPAAVDDDSAPSLPSPEAPEPPDAPPSSARVVATAVDPSAPPPFADSADRVRAALRQFLGSRERKKGPDFIASVILKKVRNQVDRAMLDELVQIASLDALEAKSPPWFVASIPGWVARVTRRAIADYFRARKDDEENLDPDAEPEATFDRHAPQTDWGAREHLIAKWVERQLGDDPVRRETFRLMMEHEIVRRSLRELAVENHTTESALSNRFFKLRRDLYPQVALMDQEKPRRAILLALFLFGLAALIVLVYGLFHWLGAAPSPAAPRIPSAPTATLAPGPAPSFDQAFPTQPQPPVEGGLSAPKPP